MIPNGEIKNGEEEQFWQETRNFQDAKRDFEYKYLSRQLQLYGGNISKTAQALGLQQSNLSRKLGELGIR
jgi:two-component system nitrogen regulation response regulator NtrX